MPTPPHTHSPARESLRLLLLAALFCFVALTSAVAPAHAGGYHVYACQAPNGSAAPTDGLSLLTDMVYSGPANSCPSGALGLGMAAWGGQVRRASGEYGSWTLAAPGNLTIASLTAQRIAGMADGTSADQSASPVYYLQGITNSDIETVEACAYYAGCRSIGAEPLSAGWNHAGWTFRAPVQQVRAIVMCGGDAGGSCAPGNPVRAIVNFASIDLSVVDNQAPAVSGAVTGTLLDGGGHRGVQSLLFTASDPAGSGVYEAIVSVDGTVISRTIPNANGGRCADAGSFNDARLEFLYFQPCPASTSVAVNADTTLAPDGDHTLRVQVRDAAGNTSTVVEKGITIDNIPPPKLSIAPSIIGAGLSSGLRPGDVLTALDGTWVGAGLSFSRRWQRSTENGWLDLPHATGGTYTVGADDVGRSLRVVVRAVNGDGAVEATSEPTPVVKSGATVVVQSVKPGGANASTTGADSSTGQLVVDREQRTVEVHHGAKVVITGRLIDAASQPIAAAAVDVFEQLAVTAAAWRKIGSVTTDSQGGYVFRPKTTASRRLRFAYSATRDSADYRATREVFVSVSAGMALRAARAVVGRQGLIRLRGKVEIDALPAGTWVEVQVLDSGVWRTIATRPTAADGRWSFRHRLRQSSQITFKFRARLRTSGNLASAESKSSPVKVRVR